MGEGEEGLLGLGASIMTPALPAWQVRLHSLLGLPLSPTQVGGHHLALRMGLRMCGSNGGGSSRGGGQWL